MRILCVTQRYFPAIGGAENLIKTYLDFLSLKHDVTVFTSNSLSIDSFWRENDSIIPDTKLDYLVNRFDVLIPSKIQNDRNLQLLPLLSNYPGPFMPDLWIELLSKEIQYDLIIVTAFPYDHVIPAFIAAKKWKIPIIVMPLIHDEFPELFLTGMRLSLLSCANTILVLSQNEKKILVDLGIDNGVIHQIIPYIKQKKKPDKQQVTLFKNQHNLTNKKIVLFIGARSSVKGLIDLLQSMKKIWKMRNDVILLLVGPPTKEYENYFGNLSKNFKKNIIDLGITDEKTKDLAFESCDLFVLPSKSESFGLVLIESWIYKKPVIGCDISSTRELINHMENGMLVSFGDVDGIYKNILTLLDDNKMAENMGKAGFEKSNQFTSSDNLIDFEKICLETINQHKSKV